MGDPKAAPLRDEHAEDALLGWLVGDPELMWRAGVSRSLFSDGWHVAALDAVRELSVAGVTVDPIAIAAAMQQATGTPSAGHFDKLAGILEDRWSTSRSSPAALVGVLRDFHRRRELERFGRLAVRCANALDGDVLEAVARIADGVAELGAEDSGLELTDLVAAVRDAAKHLLERVPGSIDGVPTGFPALDRSLGGFPFGEMSLLAGRPSQGKSALAQQIAELNAKHGDVLVCSPEMSARQLAYRSISRRAAVPLHSIRFAELSADERVNIASVEREVPAVWLFDKGRMTTDDIAAAARKVSAQCKRAGRKLRLLIVDHLQFLASMERRPDPVQEISNRGKAMKQLARELGVPALVLSQLNREVGKRKDPRPILSDLKGSGDLEADADVVLAIHRPGFYSGKIEDAGVSEVHILKNRNGATGEVRLGWDGLVCGFRDTV